MAKKTYRVMIWGKKEISNDIMREFAWNENSDDKVIGKTIKEMLAQLNKAE